MLLITKSVFKKDNVPFDTLTGIRMRRAMIVIGTKIFKLSEMRKRLIANIFHGKGV